MPQWVCQPWRYVTSTPHHLHYRHVLCLASWSQLTREEFIENQKYGNFHTAAPLPSYSSWNNMDLKDQKYVYRQTKLFKIGFFQTWFNYENFRSFNELVPVAYQWLWDVSARRPPSTTRRYSRYNQLTSPRPNPFAGPITVYAQEHSCQPTFAKLNLNSAKKGLLKRPCSCLQRIF